MENFRAFENKKSISEIVLEVGGTGKRPTAALPDEN